jgi:outer membrane protein TolC
VAVASRIPQFNITGTLGGMASNPAWMFRSGGGFFELLGNISQTLFDGGTLKARERAAREELVQASAAYRNVVITAFQNVADTLHAIQSDADYLKAALRAEQAMKETAEITRKQYESGYVSYQMVLIAEQSYQQSEVTLIQAQTNRFGDTAALYQALGGGWWNRNEAASQKLENGANAATIRIDLDKTPVAQQSATARGENAQ